MIMPGAGFSVVDGTAASGARDWPLPLSCQVTATREANITQGADLCLWLLSFQRSRSEE
jgi:hypothetical protein